MQRFYGVLKLAKELCSSLKYDIWTFSLYTYNLIIHPCIYHGSSISIHQFISFDILNGSPISIHLFISFVILNSIIFIIYPFDFLHIDVTKYLLQATMLTFFGEWENDYTFIHWYFNICLLCYVRQFFSHLEPLNEIKLWKTDLRRRKIMVGNSW